MNRTKKAVTLTVIFMMTLLSACSSPSTAATAAVDNTSTAATATENAATTAATSDSTKDDAYAEALTFNNAAWQYDGDNNVYYQIGVQYCANPETLDYETLGIYVPGAYVNATANGDGTYTITVNDSGSVSGYTARTAPIVFPVNTPGYSAQAAPTSYSYNDVSSYVQAGFIYVAAGMRGRDNGYDANGNLTYSGGAPWGVTDLKAAIRFIRYNKDVLPGNTDSIFTFGMSGGGAQSALAGATGDSPLYTPYLESIGAAMYDKDGNALSDAVTGTQAWCPITSLDYADEAYEWNMGQFATTGTRADGTYTAALSKDMATAYAEYINQLGLKDANGNTLTLTASDSGVYLSGSYYDSLMSVIEQSLNNFLSDTTFPYTPSSGGFGGGAAGGGPGGTPPTGGNQNGTPPTDGGMPAGGAPGSDTTSTQASSTTYATAQDYIDSLNSDTEWISYDASTNTANITSLAAFIEHCKNASKDVPAFDDLNRSQAENNLFGNDESDSLHFDSIVAGLLQTNQTTYSQYSDWDASIIDAYATDLKAVDKLGSSIQTRLDMYNPMYYLSSYYAGYQTSTVAKYWRINTGIDQGDTANTVEMNLALALQNYSGVDSVEFTTVWGLGHTMAERTGDSTTNFIAWVNQVLAQ